jgi:hypothetical protein
LKEHNRCLHDFLNGSNSEKQFANARWASEKIFNGQEEPSPRSGNWQDCRQQLAISALDEEQGQGQANLSPLAFLTAARKDRDNEEVFKIIYDPIHRTCRYGGVCTG